MTDVNSNYKLSRAWFDFAFENPDRCNPNHTALYMWILEKKNRLGHKEKFGLPTQEAMEILGIKSKHTYYKAFNELVEFGFIKVITESHNQYTSIVIMLCQKLSQHKHSTNTALDLALTQHEHSTVPIVKQTNQQTLKQRNNIPPTSEEFNSFCLENGFEHIAKKAFDYYSGNDWKDNQNKKVKNWKLKLQSVWFDENKNPKPINNASNQTMPMSHEAKHIHKKLPDPMMLTEATYYSECLERFIEPLDYHTLKPLDLSLDVITIPVDYSKTILKK